MVVGHKFSGEMLCPNIDTGTNKIRKQNFLRAHAAELEGLYLFKSDIFVTILFSILVGEFTLGGFNI